MRMTLRQLAVFVAVAREGTVTKASDAVQLTQSAASMALSDLESALGSPLFDRQGKRLLLNDLGRFLLPKALEILNHCEQFEYVARNEQQAIDLRLGATLTISDYMMPQIMSSYLGKFPTAQLHLQVGNTKQIIEAVSQLQLDIGLIEGSCHHASIQADLWYMDELAICAAPNSPLTKLNRPLTLNDMRDQEWIVREAGSGTREVFDRVVLQDIPEAKIRLTLGHNLAILKVVASGIGIGCVSKLAIEPMVATGDLVILDAPFWALERPFYWIVHKQKYRSPGLNAFIEHCHQLYIPESAPSNLLNILA